MKSLLLVAHGSRRAASNDEVRALTRRLAEHAGEGFLQVACAFLELADPSIPEGIEGCLRAGAAEVVVVPYFLSAGRHVAEDIPAAVARVQAAHPEARLRVAPHLGSAEGVVELLLGLARATS